MLFERTLLPAGVRVLTERMPEVRSVSLGFWIGAGSRDETLDLQGSSHFLEHLLFKGTQRRSAQDIAEAFDAVGGEANAFSAKEYTCFYARVLDKDLGMALDSLTDILTQPLLKDDDVAGERNVILEEIAMHEDTAEDLVHDIFLETLFGDHPLGREVMGTVSSVKAITSGSLRSFHEEHYRPKNIVVSAAGSVEHQQVVDFIGKSFETDALPVGVRILTDPVPSSKRRIVTRKTEQAHIVLGGIGYANRHPMRFAAGVLDNLLGGGMSSRLFQEIREKRGLVYSVYSYRNSFIETGSWAVYAGTTPSNVAQVLELIVEELDRLADSGITEPELERAKGHMRGGVVLGLEDPPSRMSRLGKSELVHGEILSLDEIIDRIDSVTRDDVATVANDLFRRDNRVLATIGPLSDDEIAEI